MKIHLRQIPVQGLHVEGEEPGDILELQDEGVRKVGPVHYDLDVGLSEGGLFATGQLSVDLELECVTCLETFPYTIEVNDFALQTELTGAELVDLTPQVREDILLALPPHPHCDWGGGKVCTGVRNATIRSEESPSAPATEGGKPNPWTKLDRLSSQLNQPND